MTTLNKFLEMFRNLKSDAVPRPPRPNKDKPTKTETPKEENDENIDSSNEPEEILVESDDDDTQSEKMPKFKKSFFKPSKKEGKSRKADKHTNSTVNTQAAGNVINVVNSKHVRWGNDYYMGTTYMTSPNKFFYPKQEDDMEQEEKIKKCNDIKTLMKVNIKPEHDYIDHISKNLGKSWQLLFLKLGYTKNQIETKILDTEKYGVSEARYKLLLEWVNNEDDATLGRVATFLWQNGERQLVKELALLYKKNKN